MAKYTLSESFNNKKGIDIWLVKPTDRLDISTFKKLESAIKIIGGYYSRFTHSFVFEKEPKTSELDEAFENLESISSLAQKAGVSERKLAKIPLGKYSSVDRRTLRSEYNDGKLLVGKSSYFDGMQDMSVNIPDDEIVWSGRDPDFEREFDYSSKPYISGNIIRFGNFDVKYKPEIEPLVIKQTSEQKSYNFYVNVEHERQVNKEDSYKLDRIDSDRKDIDKGTRVVMSMYGNKYCGVVVDKEIQNHQTTEWSFGSNEKKVIDHESVRYKVKLDNGIIQFYPTFKVDTENECDEVTVPAIEYKGNLVMPESFWTDKIVRQINLINSYKKQKAARKKQEYAMQDQRAIERTTNDLKPNLDAWLGWEQSNMDYARKITGENLDEQHFRIDKWVTELGVKPINMPVKSKTIYEKLKELNNLI